MVVELSGLIEIAEEVEGRRLMRFRRFPVVVWLERCCVVRARRMLEGRQKRWTDDM